MTKISKLITSASALAVLGFAALPAAGFAATATTTVEVVIGAECLIGNGQDNNSGTDLLVELDVASTPSEIDSGSAAAAIDITCNQGWILAESVANDLASPTNELALKDEVDQSPTEGEYNGTVGFAALGSPVTASATPIVGDLATWGDNTWGMAYTGTEVNSTALDWHGPTTTNVTIASGSATAKSSIVQYFGAKTNGSVAQGTYGATMTYTLTPQ